MDDDFQAMIDKRRARMADLRETFDRAGYLFASSARNPDYSILLTRNSSSDAPFRVTSFHGREPIGHREYDALVGAGPCRDALAEFTSLDMVLRPRGALTALCTRTRVIGAGNSFEVLIPLAEISPEGQKILAARDFVPTSKKVDSLLNKIPMKFVDVRVTLDEFQKWAKLYADTFTQGAR